MLEALPAELPGIVPPGREVTTITLGLSLGKVQGQCGVWSRGAGLQEVPSLPLAGVRSLWRKVHHQCAWFYNVVGVMVGFVTSCFIGVARICLIARLNDLLLNQLPHRDVELWVG